MNPRVISMRGRKGIVPEGAVYVGRAQPRVGLAASPFCNPWPAHRSNDPGVDGLAISLLNFRDSIRVAASFRDRIRSELRGKVLACWCGEFTDLEPVRCHAQILAHVADGGEP